MTIKENIIQRDKKDAQMSRTGAENKNKAEYACVIAHTRTRAIEREAPSLRSRSSRLHWQIVQVYGVGGRWSRPQVSSASDALRGPQVTHVCTQGNIVTAPYSYVRFSDFLFGVADAVARSLMRCDQRLSEAYQAYYGHPRCDLNLIRLSLPPPGFGRLCPPARPRGHEPAPSFDTTRVCYTMSQSLVRRFSSAR